MHETFIHQFSIICSSFVCLLSLFMHSFISSVTHSSISLFLSCIYSICPFRPPIYPLFLPFIYPSIISSIIRTHPFMQPTGVDLSKTLVGNQNIGRGKAKGSNN